MKNIEKTINKTVLIISILMILMIFWVATNHFRPLQAEAATSSVGAEIVYGTKNYSNGTIKYGMQVNLNIEKLTEGMSETDKTANMGIWSMKMSALKTKLEEKGLKVTASADGCSLSTDIRTYPSAHKRAVLDPERDGYEIYDPKEGLKTWGFYRNIYEFTFDTAFKNVANNQYLSVADEAINGMRDYGITDDNFRYVYNYGTFMTQKTLTSNADKIYFDDNEKIYIHEFVMSKDGADAKQVTLTQKAYNSTGWNITLIAIVLVALVITVLIRYKQVSAANKERAVENYAIGGKDGGI